jgi:hypothetical protein
MKTFTKQIRHCRECPNYEDRDYEVGGMTADWCLLSNKQILPKDGDIPTWCKLND